MVLYIYIRSIYISLVSSTARELGVDRTVRTTSTAGLTKSFIILHIFIVLLLYVWKLEVLALVRCDGMIRW